MTSSMLFCPAAAGGLLDVGFDGLHRFDHAGHRRGFRAAGLYGCDLAGYGGQFACAGLHGLIRHAGPDRDLRDDGLHGQDRSASGNAAGDGFQAVVAEGLQVGILFFRCSE